MRQGDYFGFDTQGRRVQLPDSSPLLQQVVDVLKDIKYVLNNPQIQVKGNVLNSMQSAVGLTAVRLLPQNDGRNAFMVRNVGSSNIYIGDQNVVPTNGFQLLLDDAWTVKGFTGEVWAVADGVGGAATVIEG